MNRTFRIAALSGLLLAPAAIASTKASYKHYLKAVLLTNRGQYGEALRSYEAALTLDPESSFLYKNAAELALETGQVDKALALAERFAELSPENPSAYHLMGNVRWARGELEAAQAAFEKTIELKPGHDDALFALGNLLGAQSPDEAKRYLDDYLKANPDDASEALYQIALIEQKAGRTEEAIARFEASIEADPDNMQSRYSLAQLFEIRRDTAAALGAYAGILERDPKNVVLLNHVGEITYLTGDAESALAHFRRAKEIMPTHPATCLWLALLAEQEENFKEAAKQVRDSAALSEDAGLNLRLSYYLTQADELDEAVAVLEKAFERWNENEDIAYFLGLGYDDLKKPHKAIAMMSKVLKLRPEHRDARFQLGAIHEKLGNIAEVELHFKELLRAHPNDASALNYLGYSLADRDLKLEEAEGYIRRAVDLQPEKGAYLDSLAWVLFKRGNAEEALSILEKAVAMLPDDETVWEHLGDVRDKLGKLDEAWSAWKKAQALGSTKKELPAKLSRAEGEWSAGELGRRYLDFLVRSRGRFESFGGPCEIHGKVGGQEFRFQAILHYRAPWRLSVDVLGPMFTPMLRMSFSDEEAFEMDPLSVEGVDSEFLQERVYESLRIMRAYLEGGVFGGSDALFRKGWRRSRIDTPAYSFVLDKPRVRLSSMRSLEKGGLELELADYRPSGGRWVPSRLTLTGKGFSFDFKIARPSVRFETDR
jgi:tetratricopeptide (TPR) repeat protein